MASNCDDFAVMRRRHFVDEGLLFILFPENQSSNYWFENRGFENMDSPVYERRDFNVTLDLLCLHQKSI